MFIDDIMAKSSIIAAVDIGTSAVKVLVIQRKGDTVEALYVGQKPSSGIRRGVVVDSEIAAHSIQAAIRDAELVAGQDINSLYVNIGGSHIFCAMSRGLVSVSRADGNISEEDVSRVLQAAKTISLSSNKEIIDVYPREFIVDGDGGVKDAIGMHGVRLEAEVLILAGFSPYLRNLDQAILKGDLEILNRIPSAIASAKSVLTSQQKELGVALLDIGAGTSNLAVYEEGDLVHLTVLPMGSANITNDLAIGLKTDVEIAERIKIERGSCIYKGTDRKIKIDGSHKEKDSAAVYSQRAVSKIIQARVIEIFDLANKEMKKIGRERRLPAGIILTGGGAKLPKIDELAKKVFQLTCRVGVPQGIANLDEDPALANVCGLALGGIEDSEGGGNGGGMRFPMLGKGFWDRIKKIIKIFIP